MTVTVLQLRLTPDDGAASSTVDVSIASNCGSTAKDKQVSDLYVELNYLAYL